MITFTEALDAGWGDYFAGIHYNRYSFSRENEAFCWWIQGYNFAREWEQSEADFEEENV